MVPLGPDTAKRPTDPHGALKGRATRLRLWGCINAEHSPRYDPLLFEQAFRNIDDVLRKEAGCTTELD